MFVGLKMLKNFVTVTPKTLVKDAEKLMEASKLWMLLVVEDDKLLGYVRSDDINRALWCRLRRAIHNGGEQLVVRRNSFFCKAL